MSFNKMSNKVLMILLILFCFVLPITSLAVEKNTEYDSYSTEEIKQITQHTDEAILKRDKSLNKVDNTLLHLMVLFTMNIQFHTTLIMSPLIDMLLQLEPHILIHVVNMVIVQLSKQHIPNKRQ